MVFWHRIHALHFGTTELWFPQGNEDQTKFMIPSVKIRVEDQ